MNIRKAVILAAGRGKRMGALSQSTPKPMLHVQNKPILEHIITGIRDYTGIREFFIITHHYAEMIETHFKDGSSLNIHCTYGKQVEPDGTGKAPEVAQEWIGNEPFLLSNGDVLINGPEYKQIISAFDKNDALISVKQIADTSQGGAVIFNNEFYLKDIIEKGAPGSTSSPWINAGIYLFNPNLFDYTAKLKKSVRGEYEITDALKNMANDGLMLKGYEIKQQWIDVANPEILSELNRKNASAV
jgi:dTDP-glucose pyrophosphorylase